MNFKFKSSQTGFSLIEVLVVIVIMSIVALSMSSMMSNMNKDFKAFDEKMSIQGLQLQIQSALSNPAFCKCVMEGHTFDYSTSTWNTLPTVIGNAYDNSCVVLGPTLLSIGTKIGSSNLRPISLQLENIVEMTPPTNSGRFKADLVIGIDQTLLVRSRKGISVPMNFALNMSGPPAARVLNSCSPQGAALTLGSGPAVLQATNFNGTSLIPSGAIGGTDCNDSSTCVLKAWKPDAQDTRCPPDHVMTGIIVRTSGTAGHHANGDGPIIQSIIPRCQPISD